MTAILGKHELCYKSQVTVRAAVYCSFLTSLVTLQGKDYQMSLSFNKFYVNTSIYLHLQCFFFYIYRNVTKKTLNGPYTLVGGKVGWEDQTKDQICLLKKKKDFSKLFEYALTFCLHVWLCESVRTPGAGITNSCKLPCRYWKINPVLCKSNQCSNSWVISSVCQWHPIFIVHRTRLKLDLTLTAIRPTHVKDRGVLADREQREETEARKSTVYSENRKEYVSSRLWEAHRAHSL